MLPLPLAQRAALSATILYSFCRRPRYIHYIIFLVESRIHLSALSHEDNVLCLPCSTRTASLWRTCQALLRRRGTTWRRGGSAGLGRGLGLRGGANDESLPGSKEKRRNGSKGTRKALPLGCVQSESLLAGGIQQLQFMRKRTGMDLWVRLLAGERRRVNEISSRRVLRPQYISSIELCVSFCSVRQHHLLISNIASTALLFVTHYIGGESFDVVSGAAKVCWTED